MASKKFAKVMEDCVSCGSYVKVCPMSAISIWKGVIADINKEKCVGCGKCIEECPAGVISLKEREVE